MKTIICVTFAVLFGSAERAVGQTPMSQPIPEATLKAGRPSSIEINLPTSFTSPYDLNASVLYLLKGANLGPMSDGTDRFTCQGNVNNVVRRGAERFLVLGCALQERQKGGDYSPTAPLRLQSIGSPDYRDYPALNLPLVTVEELPPPPPPPSAVFPDLSGATLALTVSQTFDDGAVRADKLLLDLSSHFPRGMKNSKQNRAYLLSVAQLTKILVLTTKKRDLRARQVMNYQFPISLVMFDDFIARLDKITKALGSKPFNPLVKNVSPEPHLVLAQLPKATDSVAAQASPDSLDANAEALVSVLTDMSYGFKQIAKTEREGFLWSVSTNPQGAKIFYRSLTHAEQQWGSPSDQKDQPLEFTNWIFRFDWSGCSVEQPVFPFRQNPINMTADIKDCVKR